MTPSSHMVTFWDPGGSELQHRDLGDTTSHCGRHPSALPRPTRRPPASSAHLPVPNRDLASPSHRASCSGLRHLPTPHFLPSVSSDTTRSQLLSPARPGPTYSCPAPQSPQLLCSLQPAGSCDGFRSPPHPLDTPLIPSVPGNSQDPSCPPHRTTLLTPAALVPRVHRQGWGGPWVGLAGPVQVLGRPVGAKASGRAVGIFYLFLLFVIIYAYDTWFS